MSSLGCHLGGHVLLSAEGSASLHLNDPDLIHPDPENSGDGLLHVEGTLHRAINLHAAVRRRHGHHTLGLDVGMFLIGRPVSVFYDHIGILETLLYIPRVVIVAGEDVVVSE